MLSGSDGGVCLGTENHDLRRGREQPRTAGGECHAGGPPAHKLVAEVQPKRGQRLRHRGLADAESVGRGRDRTQPGDQHERVQLGECHNPLIIAQRNGER